MAVKKFEWEDVEARIQKELKDAVDLLCAEQSWDTTVTLRAKIRTYKRILEWPHEDERRGFTERDEDD